MVTSCLSTDPGLQATRAVPQTIPAPNDAVPGVSGTSTVDSVPFDATPSVNSVPADKDPNRDFAVESGVVDFGDSKTSRDYDGFLVAVVKDIQGFWNDQFSAVYGSPFRPLDGGIHAAYRDRRTRIPGCGQRVTRYDDVQGNAFYCSIGDFMVYDDDQLIPTLVDQLGRSAVGVVLAHEFGHAVQARADELNEPTVLKEQQADCFAGAWTAHIVRGENDDFQFDDRDVRAGLIAMIQVADPVEVSGLNDADAHGTGFDRVGAFQDGFVGGVERCKPFFTENRQLVQIPFRVDPNNGNFPLHDPANQGQDVATAIPKSLTTFWTTLLATKSVTFTPPALVLYPSAGPFPACEGAKQTAFRRNVFYCRSTNQIMADESMGESLIANIGDMSMGYLISQGFSEAVQDAMNSPLRGEERVLQNDCLTGVWSRALVPGASPETPTADTIPVADRISLSAGDLDEAVITAIQRSDPSSATNQRGSAFEKIAAFREGVLRGAAGCQALN